jgi:hypothetical protein
VTHESVDIYIKERSPLGDPMPGVVVKVLSVDGRQVFSQSTTDSAGIASFLLPTQQYQMRFFKFAVNFENPLFVDVLEGEVNDFNVYGTPHIMPVSTDPRICMASGFFRTASGAPMPSLDMHFIAKFDPILLDGAAVLGERAAVRTDDRGFVAIPLIKYGQYDVTLQGMENVQRSVSVPNAASVNLPDLLFPVIKGVAFEGEGPIALAAGETLDLPARVFTTDLRELAELGSDVQWSVSDSTVLAFELLPGSILRIRGLRPGSCEVRGVRADTTTIRIPNTPIEGLPLQVVVS